MGVLSECNTADDIMAQQLLIRMIVFYYSYYEGLSVGVLRECNTADDIRAQQLLIRMIVFYYSYYEGLSLGVLSGCHTADDMRAQQLLIRMIVFYYSYYEGLSVGVLSECHTADDIRAQQLLIRVMPGFGYCTNVTLAVQGDNKQFIAHAACQNLLTSVWHGSMLPDNSFARVSTHKLVIAPKH